MTTRYFEGKVAEIRQVVESVFPDQPLLIGSNTVLLERIWGGYAEREEAEAAMEAWRKSHGLP